MIPAIAAMVFIVCVFSSVCLAGLYYGIYALTFE